METIDANFEHRFWLRILRDHMTFISMKLSPKQTNEIKRAKELKFILMQLLSTVEKSSSPRSNTNEIILIVNQVRAFKIKLLVYSMDPAVKIEIALPPTFINHMLNKLDEYVHILNIIVAKSTEVSHILNTHKLWLKGAVVNVINIISELDPTEKKIKKELKKELVHFTLLMNKTDEFIEYINKLNTDFPAIESIKTSSIVEIDIFMKILKELLSLRITKLTLGTLTPIMINHMLREEAYYLRKMGINVGNLPLEDISE